MTGPIPDETESDEAARLTTTSVSAGDQHVTYAPYQDRVAAEIRADRRRHKRAMGAFVRPGKGYDDGDGSGY